MPTKLSLTKETLAALDASQAHHVAAAGAQTLVPAQCLTIPFTRYTCGTCTCNQTIRVC